MSTSSLSVRFDNIKGPAFHLPTKVFKGHTDEVGSVAYFGDGKRMVSGSEDKTVRTWSVESKKQEGRSLEHDFEVRCLSISPDKRTLAVSGRGRVVLWNLQSRKVVWKTEEVDGWRVVFSPDGRLIAATAYNDIVLLDAETGQRIREPFQVGEEVWCLPFSPDGTQLAAGSDQGTVRVFDVATGETVVGPINAHTNYVTSALFTPDGKQIVTASHDKSIRVWDSTTGKEVGDPMLGHEYVIEQIALSNDGHHLVSAGHGRTVRVWDLSARQQLCDPLEARSDSISAAMAWSPDGQFVVAGSTQGDIFLWDVSSLENSDTVTPPLLGAGNNPWPSTSRSQTSSLSPSLLDLPAGAPIQPNPNQLPRRDDFWDTSDLDLPARTRIQISTIPITGVPLKPASPGTAKAKTAPNVPSTSSSSARNIFGRIGARFRRDKRAPETVEMQLPPPKVPKYSPVGRVALGQADARLYRAKSKDKIPKDDESRHEEWADVEVNCWDILCAIITSCFSSSRKDSQGDGD